VTAHRSDPASEPSGPGTDRHLRALLPDTPVDLVLSPGLGRRLRAGLTRLTRLTGTGHRTGAEAGGRKRTGTRLAAKARAGEGARLPEEKGAAR
jgi:hypothetical protein